MKRSLEAALAASSVSYEPTTCVMQAARDALAVVVSSHDVAHEQVSGHAQRATFQVSMECSRSNAMKLFVGCVISSFGGFLCVVHTYTCDLLVAELARWMFHCRKAHTNSHTHTD
jgi:hypothetical protein